MSQPYEIRASNYPHPDCEHGQHSNGPASLFIRRTGGPWYRIIGTHHLYMARDRVAALGVDQFLATHCELVESPEPTT